MCETPKQIPFIQSNKKYVHVIQSKYYLPILFINKNNVHYGIVLKKSIYL